MPDCLVNDISWTNQQPFYFILEDFDADGNGPYTIDYFHCAEMGYEVDLANGIALYAVWKQINAFKNYPLQGQVTVAVLAVDPQLSQGSGPKSPNGPPLGNSVKGPVAMFIGGANGVQYLSIPLRFSNIFEAPAIG
jgi:hypothetical protein